MVSALRNLKNLLLLRVYITQLYYDNGKDKDQIEILLNKFFDLRKENYKGLIVEINSYSGK